MLSNYYDQRNHLSLHFLLEFMSIFVSFMIFFYGLILYRRSKNQVALLLSIIFFAVGTFDILHTVTYEGMPYFITGSSIAKSSWFWIMARITEASMIMFIVAFRYQRPYRFYPKALFVLMVSYVFIASMCIILFENQLPLLVQEGIGPTPFKNGLEYMVSILHLLGIFIVLYHYKKEKKQAELNMVLAFLFLILGELVFTTYHSVHDLNNLLGHFYKACGYAFIFRGILVPLLYEPFVHMEFAEGETKRIKRQMDFILDHMPESVAIVDSAYNIIYVNDGFEKLYGMIREEVIGQKVISLEFQLDEQEKKKYADMLKRAFNGHPIQNYETKRMVKNGKRIIVSTTLFPIKNHLDKITSVSLISRDITELKHAEKALIKSEKLAVVGELAAGVAHEIRNPLTTIKGFMKLIEDSAKDKEKKYIQLMLDEVDRINSITNEFMTIAKPQAKKYKKEKIDQIIDDVIQFYQPNLLINNIELLKLTEEPLPRVVCEKHQIKQVMINLIKNAAEAMPNGGKITFDFRYDPEYVWIEIKDEGNGIPKEIMGRLGEPFYTLKEKGTGLGLMVCFRIIEEHRGFIHIHSEEGKGTTINIQLPINQA